MMDGEYCLRWNNHRTNFVGVFKELLQCKFLVDVTLAADGHFIQAHRLVLSACSVYFKDLFELNSMVDHPIIILKDFNIEDVQTVVDFIYQGEVNIPQSRLPNVLKTAESLQIKGLADSPYTCSLEEPNTPRLSSQLQSSVSEETEEGDERAQPTPPPKRRRVEADCRVRVKEEPSREEEGEFRVRDQLSLLVGGSTPPNPPSPSAPDLDSTPVPSPSPSQAPRPRRAVLQRQPGIIKDSAGSSGGASSETPGFPEAGPSEQGRPSDLARPAVSITTVLRDAKPSPDPGPSQQQQHYQQQQQPHYQQQQQTAGQSPSLLQVPSVVVGGAAPPQQVMKLFLPQQQQQQQQQTSNNNSTNTSLRHIQPKPLSADDNASQQALQRAHEGKEELYGHHKLQPAPLIRLISSDGAVAGSAAGGGISRAVSEDPAPGRALQPPLTQSVSQDTGLDSGRLLQPPAPASLPPSSALSYTHITQPTTGHRIALRDGPALGCNYCWNSTDENGRVQRRKTKYHCPECRTNLCIVPCYQRYHREREQEQDQERSLHRIISKTTS